MGDPLAVAQILTRLLDHVDEALSGIPLEDLARPVLGSVVGSHHEIGPGVQMEREPRLDHVDLVPDEERHHDLHRGGSVYGSVKRRPLLRSFAP